VEEVGEYVTKVEKKLNDLKVCTPFNVVKIQEAIKALLDKLGGNANYVF